MGVIGDFRARAWVFNLNYQMMDVDRIWSFLTMTLRKKVHICNCFSFPTLLTNILLVFKFKIENIFDGPGGARPFKPVLVQRTLLYILNVTLLAYADN